MVGEALGAELGEEDGEELGAVVVGWDVVGASVRVIKCSNRL